MHVNAKNEQRILPQDTARHRRDRPQIELVAAWICGMRFDLDLTRDSFNSRNFRPRRRPALYPLLRDSVFSARPALGLRALAHGAPPLDKVIIFQE